MQLEDTFVNLLILLIRRYLMQVSIIENTCTKIIKEKH